MSIDILKQELSGLAPEEQRHLMAFLLSLQESQNTTYRQKLARKIDDRDDSHFATLDELDRRLNTTDHGKSE